MIGATDEHLASVLLVERDPYPPFRADVVELFCNGLALRGLKIDWFMTSRDPLPGGRFEGPNGQSFFVGGTGGPAWIQPKIRRAWNVFANRTQAASRAIFGRYDIVQVRDLPIISIVYLLAARLSGKKFVFWLSFPMIEAIEARARTERGSIGRLNAIIRIAVVRLFTPIFYRLVLAHADHVFVQSERMKEFIRQNGVRHGRITPVPMAVRIDTYNPAKIPPSNDLRLAGKRVLVYVGTIEPLRRIDELVRALAALAKTGLDVVLVVVGGFSDGDRAALLQLAERLGVPDRLIFTGHVALAEALSFVAAAEVCFSAVPSHPLLDMGTPTKLVEYLAMGRPVVANHHPDQEFVLRESGAGICVAFDAAEFAAAARRILDNKPLADAFSAKGPPWIRANRSYESEIERVRAIYEDVLAAGTAWPTASAQISSRAE